MKVLKSNPHFVWFYTKPKPSTPQVISPTWNPTGIVDPLQHNIWAPFHHHTCHQIFVSMTLPCYDDAFRPSVLQNGLRINYACHQQKSKQICNTQMTMDQKGKELLLAFCFLCRLPMQYSPQGPILTLAKHKPHPSLLELCSVQAFLYVEPKEKSRKD